MSSRPPPQVHSMLKTLTEAQMEELVKFLQAK